MEKIYVDILSYLNYDMESTGKKMSALSYNGGIINKYAAQKIIKQADEGCCHEFSANILILADRLFGVAISLAYFFSKCSNANVLDVVTNYQEALSVTEKHPIDYLIIVGYQENSDNYRIIHKLRAQVNPPHIVLWASLDECILHECVKHKIYRTFDREKPLREFIHFLKRLKKIAAIHTLENKTGAIDKLNIEKTTFFCLCNDDDKKKVNGIIEMTYEDFNRIIYILGSLEFHKLIVHILRKNFSRFEKEINEEYNLFYSKIDIESEVNTYTGWLVDFCLSAPTKKIRKRLADIFEIDLQFPYSYIYIDKAFTGMYTTLVRQIRLEKNYVENHFL